MSKKRTIVSASCRLFLATAFAQSLQADGVLPAYDDSAFPLEERPAETRRIADELDAVVARAKETDGMVDAAFAALPEDDFLRVRLAKRREARGRTEAFARRYLELGDATGLGFAEQATADLELFDKIFREEAANLAVAPRPENNPVVLRLADFGAKGDGRTDDAEAFDKALDAVRALDGKPCILKLGKGRFLVNTVHEVPPYTSEFGQYCDRLPYRRANLPVAGVRNCAIEGEGPEDTQIRFGALTAIGIAFLNCRNCALRNVEISFDQQPFLEGEVLATDFDAEVPSIDIRLTPGSLSPDDPLWNPNGQEKVLQHGNEFTPEGEMIHAASIVEWNCGNGERCRDLGDGVWRIFFRTRHDSRMKSIVAGGFFAIPCRDNDDPVIKVLDSSYTLLEDVWVRNSRAGAVDCGRRCHMVTAHRLRVFPREGFRQASDADGFFCSPGAFLYDCHFRANADDAMNSTATFAWVKPSEDGMEVWRNVGDLWGTNAKGDLVTFLDPYKICYLGHRRVGESDEPGRKETRLESPAPASPGGMIMCAPRARGIGTIVSKCSWDSPRGTVVIQVPNAIVEDCRISNPGVSGIRMSMLADFHEGPPPYNVLVRNCTIENVGQGVRSALRPAGTAPGIPSTAPMRGIEVTGCTFRNVPEAAFDLKNTGDCRIYGNTFENAAATPRLAVCEDMDFDN